MHTLKRLPMCMVQNPILDIDASLLLREYQQFKTWLRNKDPAIASESSQIDMLDLLSKIIKSQNETTFANVFTLLKIAVTLVLMSVQPEHAFSKLRLLKTPWRSTMSNDRLSSLMTLSINRDINANTEAVIDRFARKNPRKLEYANTEAVIDRFARKNPRKLEFLFKC